MLPKSRSVGLPSEANSHLPESELRGARPLPRGKIEKLINLEKVREKMAPDSDDRRNFFAWLISGRTLALR